MNIRDALAELVALEELAVLLRGLHGTSYDWDDRQDDYNRRKPIALANARAALAEEVQTHAPAPAPSK